ncbi:hypothetical protein LCB40_02350 [Lactobacillus corticis]|uniref:Uncharacterized protein n=1 Tax=Lactobacillus corticis TaxID=2201249 RepID=A0A916VHN0_9LACO|nr:hypothetical protein LCB40_02350 [Lactobacillus corticis]
MSSSDTTTANSSSSTSAASSDTSVASDATTAKSTSSDSTSSAANSTTADSEKSSETSNSTSSTTSSDTSSLDSSVSALAASADSTDNSSTEETESNTRITDSSMTLSQTTVGNDGLNTDIEVVVHVTLKAGDKIKVAFPKGSAYRITSHDSSADGGVISDESNSSTWVMAFSATSNGTYTLHATIGDQSNYTLQPTPMPDIGTHEVAMTLSGTDSAGNSIGTTTKTFTATITPGASPKITRSPSSLTGVKTNTDYTYTLNINEANGVSDTTSYPSNRVNSADNYGTTITVPVPDSFKLDETATNTANNFTDGTTITQAATGADIIITVPKGAGNQNNSNDDYAGYKLVGSYLTDQPEQDTTLTAASNIVMVQKIDAKGTTVTFNGPKFSETLLAKDSTNVGNVGFSVNGAHDDNSILLKDDEHEYLNQIFITNRSIYNLTDSAITINLPSGFDATSIKIPEKTTDNNRSTTWQYTLTYADGTTSTGSAASGETIKASGSSAIRTAEFKPSEIASGGSGYFYVYGDLAANYDDGTAVKSDDKLTTKITWISNSTGINGTLSGTQTVAAEPVTSLRLWTHQASGQIAVYTTGNSSDTTSYVYEPIFYYVLPQHASYTGKNQWLQGDPTISTFWVNGREVIKIDYTGTQFKFNTHSNATNSMFVAISALADNGSYPGQVYIYSPHTKMSNGLASDQSTFDSKYTEGHADSNTYLVGNYSFSVSSMSSLSPVAQASGNTQGGVFATNGNSDDKGSTAMDYEIGIKNSTNTDAQNIVVVVNLPTNINYQLTGAITAASGTVYYSTKVVSLNSQPNTGDSSTWVTADQVSDWSTIKSVAIDVGTVAQGTLSSIYVFKGIDPSLGADGGKTATLKAAMYANGVTNAATTSSSIAIAGTSTIKTALQYVDADGQTHTVDLDYTKRYADGTTTMKTTDFPENLNGFSSSDQAKIQALIDQGYVFSTSNTTIKNGEKTWTDDETNSEAAFGSTVRYYFDGDTVVYVLEQGTTETTQTVQRQFTYKNDQQTLKDPTTGSTSLIVTKSVNKITGAITYTAVDASGNSYEVTAN